MALCEHLFPGTPAQFHLSFFGEERPDLGLGTHSNRYRPFGNDISTLDSASGPISDRPSLTSFRIWVS